MSAITALGTEGEAVRVHHAMKMYEAVETGQIHAPAAIPPRIKPLYPLDSRTDGMQSCYRRSLQGIEPRSSALRYSDLVTALHCPGLVTGHIE